MAIKRSALDDYLNAELGQLQRDSSGKFTLSREKALEKLAAFQLPSPQLWVSKLVQTAVAGGCTRLSIRQLNTVTEFVFQDAQGWDLDILGEAFFDPDPGPLDWIYHLKQALWSVGLNLQRPFSLQASGCTEMLIWDGQSMHRQAVPARSETVLSLSHRSLQDRAQLFREVDASRCHAEVLRELKNRCFICPIPLDVDQLRLDALQLCPVHGHSGRGCLLQLGVIQGDLPSLGLPSATRGGYAPDSRARSVLESACQPLPELPPRAALFTLLAGHLQRDVENGGAEELRLGWEFSVIHWVLDGVVIETQRLDIPKRSCSVALLASAEGLTTDLSGFQLRQDQAFQERLKAVMRLGAPLVRAGRADFDAFVAAGRNKDREKSLTAGFVGIGLIVLVPPLGVAVLGLSAAGYFRRHGKDGELARQVQSDLEKLRADWKTE